MNGRTAKRLRQEARLQARIARMYVRQIDGSLPLWRRLLLRIWRFLQGRPEIDVEKIYKERKRDYYQRRKP